MEKFRAFLKRKDIEISLRRYGIDALGAMAQGLFCSLLIGTILNTIGTQFRPARWLLYRESNTRSADWPPR